MTVKKRIVWQKEFEFWINLLSKLHNSGNLSFYAPAKARNLWIMLHKEINASLIKLKYFSLQLIPCFSLLQSVPIRRWTHKPFSPRTAPNRSDMFMYKSGRTAESDLCVWHYSSPFLWLERKTIRIFRQLRWKDNYGIIAKLNHHSFLSPCEHFSSSAAANLLTQIARSWLLCKPSIGWYQGRNQEIDLKRRQRISEALYCPPASRTKLSQSHPPDGTMVNVIMKIS